MQKLDLGVVLGMLLTGCTGELKHWGTDARAEPPAEPDGGVTWVGDASAFPEAGQVMDAGHETGTPMDASADLDVEPGDAGLDAVQDADSSADSEVTPDGSLSEPPESCIATLWRSTHAFEICGLKPDHTAWCWAGDRVAKAALEFGTDIAVIAGRRGGRCAVKVDGTLWCYGENAYGQVGDGSEIQRDSPVQVAALGSDVADVSTGQWHTCAVKRDGSAWCWGQAWRGQLGDGTIRTASENSPRRALPVQATAGGVLRVVAGGQHTCSINTGGVLLCWGDNDYGQLGSPKLYPYPTPAPRGGYPMYVEGIAGPVTDVSAGLYESCAVTADGRAWAWGRGANLSRNSEVAAVVAVPGSNAVAIACTENKMCALRGDGTVWCWVGWSSDVVAPAQVTAAGADNVEIAVDRNQACARKTDGTVWCWGGEGAPAIARVEGLGACGSPPPHSRHPK